ncbi:hypothetical protein FGO68_gene7177 [Halteria grandinella]|uniref:Uncharacterized protein n=1 Tax=Halteria grandinella TaxID=5974 RepID=A0A8J8TA13_HALGN|nr:hypothetical protein FGO68_gene7177 [Halteria grandinella]
MTIQERELESIKKLVRKRIGDHSPSLDILRTPDQSVLRALKNSASRNKLESSACILNMNEDYAGKEAFKKIKFMDEKRELSIIKPIQTTLDNQNSLNPIFSQLQNALETTQIGSKDRLSLNSNRSIRNSKSAVAPINEINCIAESFEEASFYKGQHIKITNSQISFKSNNPNINKFTSQKSSIIEISDFSNDNTSFLNSQQRKHHKPSKEISESLGGNEKAQKVFEGYKREREFMKQNKRGNQNEDSFFHIGANSPKKEVQIERDIKKLAKEVESEVSKGLQPNQILDRMRWNKIQNLDQLGSFRVSSHSVEGLRRHLRSNAYLGEQLSNLADIQRDKSQDMKQPQIMISSVYTAQVEKKPSPESPVKQLLTYQNSFKNSIGHSSEKASQNLSRGSSFDKKLTSHEYSLPLDLPQPIFIMRTSTASQPDYPLEKAPQPTVIFESTESFIEASRMFEDNGPPQVEEAAASSNIMGQLLQPLRKNKSLGSIGQQMRTSMAQTTVRQSQEIKQASESHFTRINTSNGTTVKQQASSYKRNSMIEFRSPISDKIYSMVQLNRSKMASTQDKPPSPRKKSPIPSIPILKPIKTISPIHTQRKNTPTKKEAIKTSIGTSLNRYKQQLKDMTSKQIQRRSPDMISNTLAQSFAGGLHQQTEGQLYSIESFSASGEQALNKASFLSRFTNVAKILTDGHKVGSPGNRSQASISPSPTPRIMPNQTMKSSAKTNMKMVQYKQLERPSQLVKKQKQKSVDQEKKPILTQVKSMISQTVKQESAFKETPNFPEQRSRQQQHTSIYQILKKNKSFDKFEPLNLQSSLNSKRNQEYEILKTISNNPKKPELIQRLHVEQDRKPAKVTTDLSKITYEEYKVMQHHEILKKGTKQLDKARSMSGQSLKHLRNNGYIKSIMTKYIQEGSSTNRASIDVTPLKLKKEQLPQALSSGIKHNFHQPNQSSIGGIAQKLQKGLHSQQSSLFTLNDSGYHKRQQSSQIFESAHQSPVFAERASYIQPTDSARSKRRDKFIPEMRKLGDLELSVERQQILNDALQKSVVMNINSLCS